MPPVVAIEIVRHNLHRPTSLFHETGHQLAHRQGPWRDVDHVEIGTAEAVVW